MNSLYAGLIGYWPLWEASGTRYDTSGGGTSLTAFNTPTQQVGPVLSAAGFTAASSQSLQAATGPLLGATDLTFTCWVYLTNKTTHHGIVTKNDVGGSYVSLSYNFSADRFTWSPRSLGYVFANTFGIPALNKWYFVAGWVDLASATGTIEVNATAADTGAATITAAADTTGFVYVGYDPDLPGYMNGYIAEVGMWRRVLSKQERTWLYNNGDGRTYPFTSSPYNGTVFLDRPPMRRRNRLPGIIS